MLKLHPFEVTPRIRSQNLDLLELTIRLQGSHAVRRQQQPSLFRLHHRITKIGMECQRPVVWNRPRRGGPDDRRHIGTNLRGFTLAAADYLKCDPDRGTGVVFILDLSFGQSGVVVDAPVNRLAPAVYVALLHEVQVRTRDRRFVPVTHRQVRFVPLAEDAKSLEIALVLLDVLQRIFPAAPPELGWRHFSLPAQLLFHLGFDRQTVAVPSGNVRRVVSGHAFRLHDHIFQYLVQPGAQVNRPGGIRRPIVEHK